MQNNTKEVVFSILLRIFHSKLYLFLSLMRIKHFLRKSKINAIHIYFRPS